MPHKFIPTTNGMLRILPTIAVLDMHKISKVKSLTYDEKYMISTEK